MKFFTVWWWWVGEEFLDLGEGCLSVVEGTWVQEEGVQRILQPTTRHSAAR